MTSRERYFARRERWRRAKKWRRCGGMLKRMEDGKVLYLVHPALYGGRFLSVHENSH